MSNQWEMQNTSSRGYIEAITGCMFSGKTEELIHLVRRAHLGKKQYQIFKPSVDNRFGTSELVISHSQQKLPCTMVENAQEILTSLRPGVQVVGIDEAQFFSPDIVDVTEALANTGIRVIVAGLNTDWQGRPFHPMPQILAIAEIVHKLYAVCSLCGDAASRSQRLVSSNKNILVGAGEVYQARCRAHFDPFQEKEKKVKPNELPKELPAQS